MCRPTRSRCSTTSEKRPDVTIPNQTEEVQTVNMSPQVHGEHVISNAQDKRRQSPAELESRARRGCQRLGHCMDVLRPRAAAACARMPLQG